MRNLVLILATLLTVYLYTHPRVETDVQTVVEQKPSPPPVRIVAAATPAPRMYYHSPLESGPMYPGTSANTGYYSTDPSDPRYRNLNSSAVPTGTYAAPYNYPVYSGGGSNVTNNTVIFNAPRTATRTAPAATPLPNFYQGRLPGR